MSKKMLKCFEYNGFVTREGIQIFGTPNEIELNNIDSFSGPSNQLDITETVIIPEFKPDVEQIQSMKLKTCVVRATASSSGAKILISGVLIQKITYTACDAKQSVHTAEFETPFSHFIEANVPGARGFDLTDFIILAPEDAFVQKINNREIFKNILISAFLSNQPT